MMRRWYLSGGPPNEYQCFMCLHVRTGTVLLGGWQIITQLVVFGLLIALSVHPKLFSDPVNQRRTEFGVSLMTLGQRDGLLFGRPHLRNHAYHKADKTKIDSSEVPELSNRRTSFFERLFGLSNRRQPIDHVISADDFVKDDNQVAVNSSKFGRIGSPTDSPGVQSTTTTIGNHLGWSKEDHYVAVAVTLFTLGLSALLMAGTILGRPSYLMPYFCLQVFDFVIACLNVVGYFSYLPDIKKNIKDQDGVPYKHRLLSMDQACLTFVVMFTGLSFLAFKAYLLGMVWACYKFLVRRASGLERETGFGLSRSPASACLNGRLARLVRFIGRKLGCRCCTGSDVNNPAPSRASIDNDPLLLMALESNRNQEGLPTPPPPPEEAVFTPPKYEDVLKIPANAYAPPPYYRGQFDG